MFTYPVVSDVNLRGCPLVLSTVKLLVLKIYKYFGEVTLRMSRYPIPYQTLTY